MFLKEKVFIATSIIIIIILSLVLGQQKVKNVYREVTIHNNSKNIIMIKCAYNGNVLKWKKLKPEEEVSFMVQKTKNAYTRCSLGFPNNNGVVEKRNNVEIFPKNQPVSHKVVVLKDDGVYIKHKRVLKWQNPTYKFFDLSINLNSQY